MSIQLNKRKGRWHPLAALPTEYQNGEPLLTKGHSLALLPTKCSKISTMCLANSLTHAHQRSMWTMTHICRALRLRASVHMTMHTPSHSLSLNTYWETAGGSISLSLSLSLSAHKWVPQRVPRDSYIYKIYPAGVHDNPNKARWGYEIPGRPRHGIEIRGGFCGLPSYQQPALLFTHEEVNTLTSCSCALLPKKF